MQQRRGNCRHVQNETYQSSGVLSHSGPPVRIRKSGANGASMALRLFGHSLTCVKIQHAGPKLSGYATSSATNITVAQNATPSRWRSEVMQFSARSIRNEGRFALHFQTVEQVSHDQRLFAVPE